MKSSSTVYCGRIPQKGGNGTANGGGIGLYRSVVDGDTLSSSQHPIFVFPLLCTHGTPVADMLAHSPPLPIIIDHVDQSSHTISKDEEGILLALRHRDRVRCVCLRKPAPTLQKLITVLDGDFPILDLFIVPLVPHVVADANFNVPKMFRAPHLRHVLLTDFLTPIVSASFANMENLVILSLSQMTQIPSPVHYDHPIGLFQLVSLMHCLEILEISFIHYYPSPDVERRLLGNMPRVTLPSLRLLGFAGISFYLEECLPWVTIPSLEGLRVRFFDCTIYSIADIPQSMNIVGNVRLGADAATLTFSDDFLHVEASPRKGNRMYTLDITIPGRTLYCQVPFTTQVFHRLRTVFSAVEHSWSILP